MKITDLKMYMVSPRWLFLKVETDEGVCGWGEPVVEGRADTVAAAVNELRDVLVGCDPADIEGLWQTMYRGSFYKGGPILMSAIAGVDQALWDIKGKVLSVPVYQLIGGKCRDRLKVYCWIGGDRPHDVAAEAKRKVEQGYSAIKMNATEEMHYIDSYSKVDAVCERVAAIRDAVGNRLDIAVDFHGRVHKAMAKVLVHELDQFHLMFIEEPVLPDNNEALREIARAATIPIATGERMFSRWDFKKLLADGYVDVIQPDLSHAGGISECRKIAAMAEAYDVGVAPHCPLGPIALASCVQMDIATPNVFIQEQSLGIHYNVGNDILDYLVNKSVFEYVDGFIEIPSAPGLGIEINEEKVVEISKRPHHWKNPIWHNYDGTVAEW